MFSWGSSAFLKKRIFVFLKLLAEVGSFCPDLQGHFNIFITHSRGDSVLLEGFADQISLCAEYTQLHKVKWQLPRAV